MTILLQLKTLKFPLDPADKYRLSIQTIKMSAVMAQFRKSSVSPMKMQIWIEIE